VLQVDTRRPHRGHQSEDEPRTKRRQHREREDPPVESRPLGTNGIRSDGEQHTRSSVGEGEAGDATKQREEQALGEQLAHRAPGTRSERRADRELARPRGAARHQQRRQVRARDEQHEDRRRHQDEQRLSHAPDEEITQRIQANRHPFVVVGICLLELCGNRTHLRACLLQRHLGPQSRDDVLGPTAATVRRVRNEVSPQLTIELARETQTGGEDADDRHWTAL
jgi:hypothetical protein